MSTTSTPYSTRPSTPTTAAAAASLPAILCLHGGGTSGLIFKIQLRNLLQHLRPYFRLIFLDAPYPSPAGPNVLPAFADVGPYYRWMPAEDFSSRGLEAGVREQEDAARRTRESILEVVREGRRGKGEAEGRGEIVGVLGFSQGARMSAGLLADQEEGRADGEMPRFGFGVLLCGSYPPYSLSNAGKSPLDWAGKRDEHGTLLPPRPEEVIHIPSVHVRGLLDPHLEKGRRLGRYFAGEEEEEEEGEEEWSGYGYGDRKGDGVTKVVLEFEMGHHLPQAAGDVSSGGKAATKEIVDAILRVSAPYHGKGTFGDGGTSQPNGI
ncbi:MAG: hypothetical protein Q9217_006588 [Psora testacea]